MRPATDVPGILPLIAGRWSPRAFDPAPIEPQKLKRIFEAARWAASSYNEQPWRFFLANKGDPHRGKIESFLMDANAWAKRAPSLVVAATSTVFSHDESHNMVAVHDLGLADESMSLQALHEGVAVHGMAGFDAARAKTELKMPAEWQPVAMWALGYPGTLDSLPEQLRSRELAPRTRRPLSQTVFASEANQPHSIFAG
jgi:nitroreductase